MALPTCECVKSYTEGSKLDAIYCALLEIANAGGGVTLPVIPAEGGTGVVNPNAALITANNPVTLLPNRVFTLVLRGLVLTTAASPIDLGSVALPVGVTRWRTIDVTVEAASAAGTLVASILSFFTQAAGGGTVPWAAVTLNQLTAAGLAQTYQNQITTVTVATDPNLFVRQTTNSGNAGTVDIFMNCIDMSP